MKKAVRKTNTCKQRVPRIYMFGSRVIPRLRSVKKYFGSIVKRIHGLDDEVQHTVTCGWINWKKISRDLYVIYE